MDTQAVIDQLSRELPRVRRLRPPVQRMLLWTAAVVAISAVVFWVQARRGRFDLTIFEGRIAQVRTALECAGAALTGLGATLAAFMVSIPGRSARWRWLPAPGLALWLGASGTGCWQNGLSLHEAAGPLGRSPHCFVFIVGVSVPLLAALLWVLRRARPIAPLSVTLLGALGSAGSAAFLLEFFHPFDVSVADLALHGAAVAVVLALAAGLGRPLLAERARR